MICRIDFYKNRKSTTKRKTRRKEKCGQKNLLNDSALFPPHSPAGIFSQVVPLSRGTCGRRGRAGRTENPGALRYAPPTQLANDVIMRVGVTHPPQNAMTSILLLLSQENILRKSSWAPIVNSTTQSEGRCSQPSLFWEVVSGHPT